MPRSPFKILLVAGIALLLIAFVAFDLSRFLTLEGLDRRMAGLSAIHDAEPWLFTSAFVLAYILLAALSLPGATAFSLMAGAIFGLALGSILSILSSTIGATLAFVVGRYLLRDWAARRWGPRFQNISDELAKDGGYVLFLLRLAPVLPFLLTNLIMALSPMRVRTFALVTLLGIIPGTLIYTLAGLHLDDIEGIRAVMSPSLAVGFALLGFLPLVIKKLIELKQIKNRTGSKI